MKRVFFVTLIDVSSNAGAGVATKEMTKAIAKQDDINLHLICPEPIDELPHSLNEELIDSHYLSKRFNGGSIKWRIKTEFEIFAHVMMLILRSGFPTFVVGRFSQSFIMLPALAGIFSLPYFLLIRGMVIRTDNVAGETKFATGIKKILEFNAKIADEVYIPYMEIKDNLLCSVTDDTSIVQFPNAVDSEKFRPIEKEYAIERVGVSVDRKKFTIGFVGAIAERHCVPELIRAVKVVRQRGIDVELLIIGDGPLNKRIRSLLKEIDMTDHVHLCGEVNHNDVHVYISACDIMYGVVSNNRPSNPIKCYEYLACERPIITSEKSELSFVDSNNLGEVIDAVDPNTIAEAIINLHNTDESVRKNMGERGRDIVAQDYSWERLYYLIKRRLNK
jgi:glycosyltransferase involved in cell wall biosynthesis